MKPTQHVRAAKLVKTLKPDQLKLAVYMAMPSKFRPSMKRIAEELGVGDVTLWNWRQDPEFEAVRRELVRSYFLEFVPDVIQKQHEKAVNEGDTAAARLFLEFVKEMEKIGVNGPVTNNYLIMPREEVESRIAELKRKTSPSVIDVVSEVAEQTRGATEEAEALTAEAMVSHDDDDEETDPEADL